MPDNSLAPMDPANFDPNSLIYRRQQTTIQALEGLDGDPQEAGRAVQLGNSTGTPPELIAPDLEHYDSQYKAGLTAHLVNSNDFLRQYIEDKPLAATISQNDWGLMDEISQGLQRMWPVQLAKPLVKMEGTALGEAVQGFKEGFGREALDARFDEANPEIQQFYNYIDSPIWRHLAHAALPEIRDFEGSMAALQGATVGGASFLASLLRQTGAHDLEVPGTGHVLGIGSPEDAVRDLVGLSQVALPELAHPGMSMAWVEALNTAAHVRRVADAYIKAGVPPPPGLHPIIDELYRVQTEIDQKNLKDLEKKFDDLETTQIAPEYTADFIRQHVKTEIGVSAEAVRKNEAKFDFIPDLQEKLKAAEDIGGDISIPLEDWITKLKPEDRNELRDDIRIRSEGLTPNEVKELKTEEVPTDMEDQIRQAAGLAPLVQASRGLVGQTADIDGVPHAVWYDVSEDGRAAVKPTELWTENEQKILANVNQELERILPNWAHYMGASKIELGGQPVQGLFAQFHDQVPLITWSLEAQQPHLNVARHEALHFLRQMGLFTESEWSTLVSHAIEHNWTDKYHINERYAHLDENGKLEEAIADGFGEWRAGAKTTDSVHAVFEKIKAFLESIKKTVLEAIGEKRDITAQDLFLAADVGEIGRRQPKPLNEGIFAPKASALSEEELVAKAGAYGLTKDQMQRHLELVAKQRAEEANARAERVAKAEALRQTKEWKDNRKDMRAEVEERINARPDVAADEFFRNGRYLGAKVRGKPKLLESAIPEEYRAVLKDHTSPDGFHPDDLAGQFGYGTGSELVKGVGELAKQREESGLQPKEFLKRTVEGETDRAMEARYGKLNENILSDVKDQLYSKTSFDLLHDDLLQIGMKAGIKPLDRLQVEAKAKEDFKSMTLKRADENHFLQLSGKAGRKTQDAMRAGKWDEALKHSYEQFRAMLMAKEAKKLQGEREKFDVQAKSLAARTKESIEQDYLNWIHKIYTQIGKPIKQTEADLRREIEAGDHETLSDFVGAKRAELLEVEAPEFLTTDFKKDYESLTTDEFRAIRDSVTTLVENGRMEKKVFREGIQREFDEVRDEVIASLKEFTEKNYDAADGRWLGPIPPKPAKLLRTFLAQSLQMESLFHRWDHGDPRGAFTRWFFRPLAEAANEKAAMEREYSRRVRALGEPKNLKGLVPNPLFRTPPTAKGDVPGRLMQFTRKNLLGVLLNIGNESNLSKLAKGYNLTPEAIKAWAFKYATKEDLDFVQNVGNIFKDLKVEADKMYRRMSGIAPTQIEIKPFETPRFGTYDGWYYPLIPHELWEGQGKVTKDSLEGQNYTRATTPNPYTKERTGATYPLSVTLDAMTNRMGQMIHDITMREAVVQFAKLAYDKKIRNEIKRHYGQEYADLLIPYIRDVANVANYNSAGDHVFSQWSEFYRQNMIASLVGLNPNTVLKHGPTAAMNSITEVGAANFLKAAWGLLKTDPETGERNWSFAMENSSELQRRHRNYFETLGGADKAIQGKATLRDTIIKLGATPVAISDLLSAVPTWMAKYEDGIRAGLTKGEAVAEADTAVRRAHGSTAITSRPAIARGGGFKPWVSSLYGFFSHILNRQYEMGWRAKDALGMAAEGDIKGAVSQVPKIAGMFFSYVIFPAMVESAVQGEIFNKDPWPEKVAKALAFGLSSSWIGVRDALGALIYGHDPSLGLFNTSINTIGNVFRDVKNINKMGRQKAGMVWQHANTALGLLTGWSNAQIGKTGRYLYNVKQGLERPKGFLDLQHGLRFGTGKERK